MREGGRESDGGREKYERGDNERDGGKLNMRGEIDESGENEEDERENDGCIKMRGEKDGERERGKIEEIMRENE